MYHYPNHQLYHQAAYQPQCSLFVDHTKHLPIPSTSNIPSDNFTTVQHNSADIHPESVEIQCNQQTLISRSAKKKITNKSVDTSNFSIEERLVAAVWVHERKNTKKSMSQIKQDFCSRFGRSPPAKNTLLVWEQKLFSTGSVHDAPRSGRPVNRRARMEEVLSSVRAAPALSLRARALQLRVPRTTLATILRRDVGRGDRDKAVIQAQGVQNTAKSRPKKTAKGSSRRKMDAQELKTQSGNTSLRLNNF